MANKASDQLHRLIWSMNKAEKRYFKLQVRQSGGTNSNHERIFDAIDKQEEYDEEALLDRFKGEAFVNQFSITKKRLYDAILKGLDSFHANSSTEAKLRWMLHSAEILYKKTLYDQAIKILRSAKKMAFKHEKHTILLDIFMWEKLLIEKDNYEGYRDEDLVDVLEQDRTTLEKLLNYSELWSVKSRLFHILHKRGKARTKEELKNFKEIIDHTLLKNEERASYYQTRYLFHHIYSAYYFATGNYEKSYEHLSRNVTLIEEHLDKYQEEPNVYFSVLTNIIYVGSRLKRYKEVFEYLEKLRAIPKKMEVGRNEDMEIKLFSSSFSIELTLHAMTGEFEKGIELIPEVEQKLEQYGHKINKVRKAYFYFNIAVLYFGAGDLSSALRWINRLLDDIDIEESEDIYCFGQILSLIIHMELDNRDLIPYVLRSTYRYLQTRNRIYQFENLVLKFINKIPRMNDRFELEEAYEEFYEQLLPLKEDSFERTAFEYFDFVSWVESKVKGKSFKSVVKEKAKTSEPKKSFPR